VIPSFAVIVVHDKHGRRYLDATATYAFSASVKALLAERVKQDWYVDEPEEQTKAEAALASDDSYKCWEFLTRRNDRDHEYEHVECVALERFTT